jgi:hypothetical protein
VTDAHGRFSLPNLPDGSYTATITSPAGYAPASSQALTLTNGGALAVALRPLGRLSGVIYDDWDGDGRRGADEPLETMPITVTVAGVGSQRTVLGSFRSRSHADHQWQPTDQPAQKVQAGAEGRVIHQTPHSRLRGIGSLGRRKS